MLNGFRIGMDMAFPVTGLTWGASQSCLNLNPIFADVWRDLGDGDSQYNLMW